MPPVSLILVILKLQFDRERNEMSENVKKSLIDFTDDELLEAYRSSMKNAQWSPANYRKEIFLAKPGKKCHGLQSLDVDHRACNPYQYDCNHPSTTKIPGLAVIFCYFEKLRASSVISLCLCG